MTDIKPLAEGWWTPAEVSSVQRGEFTTDEDAMGLSAAVGDTRAVVLSREDYERLVKAAEQP